MKKTMLSMAAMFVLTTAPAAAWQAEPVQRIIAGEGVDSISWIMESPDGRLIAGAGDRGLSVYDRRTGQVHRLGVESAQLQWNQAGDRIVFQKQGDGNRWHIWTVAIDPATGRAAGAPRRVSLEPGVGATFSPDGSQIAYFRERTGGGRDLVVIPASGGPAREVVKLDGAPDLAQWSPDGEWIYFGHYPGDGQGGAARVRVPGGPVERLAQGEFRGLSADGRYIALLPEGRRPQAPMPLLVATAEGREVARTDVPVFSYAPAWSGSGHRILFNQLDIPMQLYTLDLDGGTPRALDSGSAGDALPVISPRGDRIAVQRRTNTTRDIAVLDRSGKLIRRYATGYVIGEHAWSPDARRIAYYAGSPRALTVLDLETGREQRLAGDPVNSGRFAWRRDGNAIIRIERPAAGPPAAIVELGLDGGRRVLGRMPLTDGPAAFTFVGDSLLAVWAGTKLHRIDLRTGRDTVVFTGVADRAIRVAVSPDGRTAAIVQPDRPGAEHRDGVTLVPLYGGAPRQLPFSTGCGSGMQWHPSGEFLVIDGLDSCSSRWEIYLVPTNGGTARTVTSGVAGVDFDTPAVSPDGRTMVFAAERGWHNRFAEIDFAPVLGRR